MSMKILICIALGIALFGSKHQTKNTSVDLVNESISFKIEDYPLHQEESIINFNPKIALNFMNSYIDYIENRDYEQNFVDKNILITNEFKSTYNKLHDDALREDPEYGLGFDPILDAQDYPEEGFEILNYDSISGFVVLKGKNWEAFTVSVKLKLINNSWLVDGAGVINIPEDKQREK
jgi:hypothetical protein